MSGAKKCPAEGLAQQGGTSLANFKGTVAQETPELKEWLAVLEELESMAVSLDIPSIRLIGAMMNLWAEAIKRDSPTASPDDVVDAFWDLAGSIGEEKFHALGSSLFSHGFFAEGEGERTQLLKVPAVMAMGDEP